jgi:hypothetical protein
MDTSAVEGKTDLRSMPSDGRILRSGQPSMVGSNSAIGSEADIIRKLHDLADEPFPE